MAAGREQIPAGQIVRVQTVRQHSLQGRKASPVKLSLPYTLKAKDGGSILRPAVLDEIELLNQFIMHNISVPTDDAKYNLTYQE